MIYAYDKQYLDDAMRNLGEMMDYAANECALDMDRYMDMFIASGLAAQFGVGTPKVVSGMSGTELVWEVMQKTGTKIQLPEPKIDYEYSAEYWCGWILAFYQWFTGLSFKDIRQIISMKEILKLYPTLHEASEEKFVDTVNRIARQKNIPSKIQTQREIRGLTQSALAEKSGVKLRTIQQYETRERNINRAAAGTLSALSRVLGCQVEDLLEYDFGEIEED